MRLVALCIEHTISPDFRKVWFIKMKKPLIGISPQYDYERNRIFVVKNYLDSIRITGGIPILLPLKIQREDLEDLISRLDGVLFTGGPDIDPFMFGEETMEHGGIVVPERDQLEELLFHLTYHSNKPILGICRGIQVINVFLGGTLYQDLRYFKSRYGIEMDYKKSLYPIEHYQKSENHVLSHSVVITTNSMLHQITSKEEFRVNSFHHQGIKEVAPSLSISAVSKDALVEAVELKNYKYLLGVQWHPEHLTTVDENSYHIFKSFINAC